MGADAGVAGLCSQFLNNHCTSILVFSVVLDIAVGRRLREFICRDLRETSEKVNRHLRDEGPVYEEVYLDWGLLLLIAAVGVLGFRADDDCLMIRGDGNLSVVIGLLCVRFLGGQAGGFVVLSRYSVSQDPGDALKVG